MICIFLDAVLLNTQLQPSNGHTTSPLTSSSSSEGTITTTSEAAMFLKITTNIRKLRKFAYSRVGLIKKEKGMEAKKRPKSSVEMLLIIGSKAFTNPLLKSVSDDTNEALCGWRLARPRPEYRITNKKKYKRTGGGGKGSMTSLPSFTKLPHKQKTMNGRLTEDYDYIYESRSSDMKSKTMSLLPQPVASNSTVSFLNPILVNRSESLSQDSRNNIQKLAQRQLKSDIAYEQMIIDEKLKTIDMNSISGLKMNGMFEKKKKEQDVLSNATFKNKKWRGPVKPRVNPMPRPLDLTLIQGHTPSFKMRNKPALRSSFSRLLESSSVLYSDKK